NDQAHAEIRQPFALGDGNRTLHISRHVADRLVAVKEAEERGLRAQLRTGHHAGRGLAVEAIAALLRAIEDVQRIRVQYRIDARAKRYCSPRRTSTRMSNNCSFHTAIAIDAGMNSIPRNVIGE